MSVVLTSPCEEQLRREMYKRIEQTLKDIRSGCSSAERVILIVPAQSTLQAEEDGFRYLGGDAFFDFAVMSGAKLRSDIMNETGAPGKTAINTIGRKMLLRRIASKRQKDFVSFGSVCGSESFLDMAGDFIVQLKQNDIDPVALASINSGLKDSGSSILSSKLSDMQLIYADYESIMAGKYTDSEDLLDFATGKIKESSLIRSSVIWYYDFYSFTKREYLFLNELKNCAADFNAAVLAGEDRYICGEETAEKLSKELDIDRVRLAHTEENKKLRIINCSSPYSQSRTIAADILSKHRDKGIGYGDMIVLTQDMEGMGENLKRVLTSFGIPVFMDEKRSMRHSLGARVVSSCLDVIVSGFKRQAVLSFLKCGITGYSQEDISLFENYVRQYKIFDKGFLKPFKYGKDKLGDDKFSLVESMREGIEKLFIPFADKISGVSRAEDKSRVLYEFLTAKLDLPEVLRARSAELEAEGFLDASQEMIQSFEAVTGLMDQMSELFGDDAMSTEEFADLFVSCFEDIKIGVLPQAEGRVRIGSVTRTSFSDIKVLYIAGFNDGIIPSDPLGYGILTETELMTLSGAGYTFAKTSDTLQKEELYQIERALYTDTEETAVCISMTDLEGNGLNPSPLLSDLSDRLDFLPPERDIDESADLSGYIQSRESAGSVLPRMLKRMTYGEEIPEVWKAAYNEMRGSDLTAAAAEAIFFDPEGGSLERGLSKTLFEKSGDDYYSPTQLEQFSACPFKHFVNHGLRPEELELFDVGNREAGTIYHEVLLELSEMLTADCREKGIAMTDPASLWMTVSEEKVNAFIDAILDKNKDILLGGVMESDDASEYRVSRIRKVCRVFAKYMIDQVRKGKVSAMYFETRFGRKGFFPPVVVQTGLGKAYIEGQIDRVDVLGTGTDRYVKIIDYKSGNKEFSKEKIAAGLDLQLMVYLEGALGSDEGLKPAGVFYYAVKDPDRDEDYADVIADEISGDLAEKTAKGFALDGMAVTDPEVLSAIDEGLVGAKPETKVVRLRRGNKNLISPDEMEEIRNGFKEKLKEICGKMMDGNISVSPAFFNRENVACKFCDYSSICLKALK